MQMINQINTWTQHKIRTPSILVPNDTLGFVEGTYDVIASDAELALRLVSQTPGEFFQG